MVSFETLGPRIIASFADGEIVVTESTVWGLIIAAVIAAAGIFLGSGLKTVPRG